MQSSNTMSGYDFVSGVMHEFHDKAIELLIKYAGNDECCWLEFKAGMQLLPEDIKKGAKPEDLYWKIAVAVIALMNSCGGAVIIGIEDKTHKVVPLQSNDPRHVIEKDGLEAYRRKEILERINPANKTWRTSKGTWKLLDDLPDNIEIVGYKYKNEDIAVILVKPCEKDCVRVMFNEISEQLPRRENGQIGEIKYLIGSRKMTEYESTRLPRLESIYNLWEQLIKEKEKSIRENAVEDILNELKKSLSASLKESLADSILGSKKIEIPQFGIPQDIEMAKDLKNEKISSLYDILIRYYMFSAKNIHAMDILDVSSNYEYYINLISGYIFSQYPSINAERFYQHPTPTFGTAFSRFDYALKTDMENNHFFSTEKTSGYYSALKELHRQACCFNFDSGRDINALLDRNFLFSLRNLLSFVLYIRNQYIHERLRVLDFLTPYLCKTYMELMEHAKQMPFRTNSNYIIVENNEAFCLNSMLPHFVYKNVYSRSVTLNHSLSKPTISQNIHRQKTKTKNILLGGVEFIEFSGGEISYIPCGWKQPTESYVEPFAISKYPITNQQFINFLKLYNQHYQSYLKDSLFMKHFRSLDAHKQQKLLDCAVYYIGWQSAAEYCNYFSRLLGRSPAYDQNYAFVENTGVHLPSESEWCFAVTGGQLCRNYVLPPNLICSENRGVWGKVTHNPSLDVNAFGVAGMLGNIWEWTNTDSSIIRLKKFEHDFHKEIPRKIIKGGSFATSRRDIGPTKSSEVAISNLHYIGFRLAIKIQ